MSRGGSKRNVAFIQGEEPKFLQEFKRRAGYLAGPALEEKFLGGKLPKKSEDEEEESGSESPTSDDEVDRKRSRRGRGFSPTSRFGTSKEMPPDRSESPEIERADEKPLVVGKEGELVAPDVVADVAPEEKDAVELDHTGQIKSGGTEMSRSLDAVYSRSQAKSKTTSAKAPEIVDVDKLVATGGKFVFKKRTGDHPVAATSGNDDKDDDEETPSGSSTTAKRWRLEQDVAAGKQASSLSAKKKSESRAVADRKLLSFDVIDD